MKKNLFHFTEHNKNGFAFRWTKKHYEYCLDNKIFLEHRGRKIYQERNVFTFNKGDKIRIDDNVIVEEYATMPYKNFSSVGAFSFPTCHFSGNVHIGRFCSIASNVKIMGGNHPMNRFTTHMLTYNGNFDIYAQEEFASQWELKSFDTTTKNPVIGHDVWIGNDVVLKGGITIGNGAVIAANSVVTKDVPPYAVVAGIPARVIKYRFSKDIIEALSMLKWWDYNYVDLPDNNKCDDVVFFTEELRKKIDSGIIQKKNYKTFNLSEVFRHL